MGVPTAVLVAHVTYYGQWIEDDAGITFSYARSLASGAGPVLQAGGEPVEAYSDPAWLAVLVVGHWSGLFDHGTWFGLSDLVVFPKVAAVLCCVGIFAAIHVLARTVSRRPAPITVVAGTTTALVPSFVIWTTSGLENALFALAVVALAVTMARGAVTGRLLEGRAPIVCGVLAALAALTRPDGLIYGAAFPLAVLLLAPHQGVARRTRAAVASVGAFLVPISIYGTWRLVTFGDWLPNTARAKRQGIPGLSDLDRPAELIGYTGWLTVLLGVSLVVVALRSRSVTRTAVAMVLIPLGLALTAFAVLNADWMGQYRFATPIWPLASLAVTLSLAQVVGRVAVRTKVVLSCVAVVAVAVTAVGYVDAASSFRRDTTAPLCFVAQTVGLRINSYADILGISGGTLLAVDGGGTSLSSRMRFVDFSGLADARIARYWDDNDMVGLRDYVFDEVRPTFFKNARAWGGGAQSGVLRDPRLQRDYVLLWSPEPGSGTWVRREAVSRPDAVDVVRQWASKAYAAVDVPYLQSPAQTQWRCGPTLTPESRSPYPEP